MPDPTVPSTLPETPAAEDAEQKPAVPEVPEVPKAPEVVEKSRYDASVREMNLKQQEAALLRKEIELVKQQLAVKDNQPAVTAPQEPTQAQKEALEDKYGVPYSQIQLQNDLLDLKLGGLANLKKDLEELSGTIYEGQFEQAKEKLKSKDVVFQHFEPEIEARLRQLPPRKRLDPVEIKRVRLEVIGENYEKVVELAREEGIKSVRPEPPTLPGVNGVSAGGASAHSGKRPSTLTAEQRAIAEKMNVAVDDVEKLVNGQRAPSGWNGHMG